MLTFLIEFHFEVVCRSTCEYIQRYVSIVL